MEKQTDLNKCKLNKGSNAINIYFCVWSLWHKLNLLNELDYSNGATAGSEYLGEALKSRFFTRTLVRDKAEQRLLNLNYISNKQRKQLSVISQGDTDYGTEEEL